MTGHVLGSDGKSALPGKREQARVPAGLTRRGRPVRAHEARHAACFVRFRLRDSNRSPLLGAAALARGFFNMSKTASISDFQPASSPAPLSPWHVAANTGALPCAPF